MAMSVSSREMALMHKHEMERRARRPKQLTITKAENGGHVIEHEEDNYPRKKHVFGKTEHAKMHKHIHDYLGCCKGGSKEEEESEKGEMK